jgi:hypothetical protein
MREVTARVVPDLIRLWSDSFVPKWDIVSDDPTRGGEMPKNSQMAAWMLGRLDHPSIPIPIPIPDQS